MARAPFTVGAALAILASAACHSLQPLQDRAIMGLSVSSLSFEAALGGPDPASQTVTVQGSGGEPLAPPTVSITYASGAGWLTAAVSGGGAPYTVTVRPSLAGLTAGDWSATVEVSSSGATGSPLPLEVKLRVTSPSASAPVLGVSPSSLPFHAALGGPDPASQTLAVGNSGGGALAPPRVSIAYASGAGWLSATVSGGAALYAVTVQPAIAGLAAGEWTATLSISSDGAATSPRSVAVALTLSAAPPSTPTPKFSLSTPVELSSLTDDTDCWFDQPEHAVFTTAGGTTWVATAEHHGCDTRVDRVVMYGRAGSGGSFAAAPASAPAYSYDYSVHAPSGTWALGITGPISMAASSAGDPQVLVNQQKWDGWIAPARSVYLRPSGASWDVEERVLSDEALQTFTNAPRSSYAFSVVDDLATDTLHLLGWDAAPGTTTYHAVCSSAAVGTGAPWPALGAIDTSTGAVGQPAVMAPSQDIRGGSGMQVWVEAPSCALVGRERSGGTWGPNAIDVPLSAFGCSGDASARWNLCDARSETLLSQAGAPAVLFAAAPCDARSLSLLGIARPASGSWSALTQAIAWGTGVASWRAFDAPDGRIYVVHTDQGQKSLMLYDVATGEELTMYTTQNTIGFVDAERHDPKVIVWTESDSARWHLEVADLVPGT